MRVVAAILVALAVTSPAGAAPSFDCAKAQTRAETRICGDEDLQWSDRQLARLYTLALKEATDANRLALIEGQRRFLAERDACGTVPLGCVESLYHRRLLELATKVNVHDAYATFKPVEFDGFMRVARFGFVGAVTLWSVGGRDHHICTFEEDNLTQTGKGLLKWQGKDGVKACHVYIIPEGDDLRVDTDCRYFCGAKARMDGLYKRVP